MNICVKRRAAPVGYTIDWGRGWLGTAAIVASGWTVDGGEAGLSAAGGDVGEGGHAGCTRATISGGVPGARYTVRGHVELSDGRRASRALTVEIGGGR